MLSCWMSVSVTLISADKEGIKKKNVSDYQYFKFLRLFSWRSSLCFVPHECWHCCQDSGPRCGAYTWDIPVLGLVVSTHVRTPQLLNQDADDADEQDEVHLGEKTQESDFILKCWSFFHPLKTQGGKTNSLNESLLQLCFFTSHYTHTVSVLIIYYVYFIYFFCLFMV